MKYKKILVIRLDRIGDVVLSTPLLEVLRGAYPEASIDFMCRPYTSGLLEGNPYLRSVIEYDKSGRKGILNEIKLILSLRAERYDLALILHPTVRSNIIPFLAGIPKRVGFYTKKMGNLLTDKVEDSKRFGTRHESDYILDIARYLNIDVTEGTLPCVWVNEDTFTRVKERLRERGADAGDKVVVVNPSSSSPSKTWPADRFARVADRLISGVGVKVVVISDKERLSYARKMISLMKERPIDMSGDLSVGEMAALLKAADLCLSNDSGPVHVSTAVGTPVISIFGRREPGLGPVRWGPLGPDDIALSEDPGCERCLADNCILEFKCLDMLTPDKVFRAVVDRLGRIPPKG